MGEEAPQARAGPVIYRAGPAMPGPVFAARPAAIWSSIGIDATHLKFDHLCIQTIHPLNFGQHKLNWKAETVRRIRTRNWHCQLKTSIENTNHRTIYDHHQLGYKTAPLQGRLHLNWNHYWTHTKYRLCKLFYTMVHGRLHLYWRPVPLWRSDLPGRHVRDTDAWYNDAWKGHVQILAWYGFYPAISRLPPQESTIPRTPP